jgi:deoxyribodipyrimidine photo-lyase
MAKVAARPRLVVSDDFPSFVVRKHNAKLAEHASCAFVVVDDCAVIPLAIMAHEELGARTVRPKVTRALDAWLRPIDEPAPRVRPPPRIDLPVATVDLANVDARGIDELVAGCAIDHGVPPVDGTPGGSREAERRLAAFVRGPLFTYDTDHNDPSREAESGLSPYLHFGMVSARRVALEARAWGQGAGIEAFLEQLLVRRALSFNFARSRPDHAEWTALPTWARATLEKHSADRRRAEISLSDLEAARSPDDLWNAAMNELRARGVIQSYARMLWGKLPLLWMSRPEKVHAAMVHLNDKWALDGRDPNGYANVSWCFGLHDRPWPEREVFGTVRPMTSASARRRLDFESYIERWNRDARA